MVAALDLLIQTTDDELRAVRIWVSAGVLGAAFGPAVGGVLTETLGWQSIFFVQVPLALLPLVALRGVSVQGVRTDTRAGRPRCCERMPHSCSSPVASWPRSS